MREHTETPTRVAGITKTLQGKFHARRFKVHLGTFNTMREAVRVATAYEELVKANGGFKKMDKKFKNKDWREVLAAEDTDDVDAAEEKDEAELKDRQICRVAPPISFVFAPMVPLEFSDKWLGELARKYPEHVWYHNLSDGERELYHLWANDS